MGISVGGLNNIYAKNSELVSGKELEQVSREIFQSASTQSTFVNTEKNFSQVTLDKFQKVDTGLKVFGPQANTDAATIKQMATNRAGYDVNLSPQALQAIESIKQQAALAQTANIQKVIEGKQTIPAQVAAFEDFKSAFLLPAAAQMFGTDNLGKDKRGSNPFFVSQQTEDEESEPEVKSLNLFF